MLFENENVYLVTHNHTNPAFNLAAEEYFLCRRSENFIMLWRNEPSIIIGKNQNAYAELDMDYVKKNGISVIRRLTGGGAVFHDLGNLNFTLIKNDVDGLADFRQYLRPVIGYLHSLGLNAEFSGRNDILVDGMKVSGSAQANYKGRVMLHGTLLFDVSMDTLSAALKPNPLKLSAKGIKSVRSRVTNIKSHLTGLTIDSFSAGLEQCFSKEEHCLKYTFSEADELAVNSLVHEKYSTFSWNIGYAPPYTLEKSVMLSGGIVTACFNVKNGIIEDIRIFGDFFGAKSVDALENIIKNIPYEPICVRKALSGITVDDFIHSADAHDIEALLF